MNLIQFFRSDTNYSSMRLGFIICVLTGCLGGIGLCVLDLVINKGKNIVGLGLIIAAYLSLFTPPIMIIAELNPLL